MNPILKLIKLLKNYKGYCNMERDKLILSKLLFQIMIQKNFFFKARPGVSENDMRKGYKGFREFEKLSLFNV